MTELEALWKGLLAGVAIAAPVGPVNVLCLRRTLSKGWKSGLVSGFGAAVADAWYGGIAAFSVRIVIQFLRSQETKIKLIGGLLLIGLGIRYWLRPAHMSENEDEQNGGADFASAFLLTLANPTTILSFLAVLAALGAATRSESPVTLLMVAGIFSGSMTWWILLTVLAERLRDRFNESGMKWMNRVAAMAIAGFGVFTFISGWLKSRG
jgi:threonine/homoserine/homoserine lactone efflux protein